MAITWFDKNHVDHGPSGSHRAGRFANVRRGDSQRLRPRLLDSAPERSLAGPQLQRHMADALDD
jgi:hypothetical protein